MGRPDVGRMHAKKSLHFFREVDIPATKKIHLQYKTASIKERKIHAKIYRGFKLIVHTTMY